ncbi:NUDIX hydrolase [Segnochrobactrum spirostomi]|uniref:NUDIX hydrolase n=1 Tax=Segnochrobactrum spirostomi TaxID=2608987 RepID=A0A6A7Y0I4_9HYPH|nr:NUDIX hydrolase [Segnochrobactrum spirostomi]MQT11469.1 NUDIX hydrolase [Segnochrobactrum spirostomi]
MKATTSPIASLAVAAVERVEIHHRDGQAAFEAAREAEIAAFWAPLVASNPALYNGRVFLFEDLALEGGALVGTARTAGFATLLALIEWQGEGLLNLFGCAALLSREGDVLLGRMGAQTATPGAIKFVGGTPDASDLRPDGRVDLLASIRREAAEETGLDIAAEARSEGLLLVRDGPIVALVECLRFDLSTDELISRVRAFLAADPDPELADVAVARRVEDAARDEIPRYTRIVLEHLLAGR